MINFCDCNNNIKKKRNIGLGLFKNYTTQLMDKTGHLSSRSNKGHRSTLLISRVWYGMV